MKLAILVVGKTVAPFLKEGIDVYLKRLPHYIPTEYITIQDLKQTKKLSIEQIKKAEGELILKQSEKVDLLILMDERGKQFTSKKLALHLQQKMNAGTRTLGIVIGGAYGFSEDVYAKAQEKWSLSNLTFSHQMVRLFLLEQLYRSFTILKGEPYHHE
ncbi:MAG: 23S rRNA (pseudouridine1915-N3)-methyltransferase [Flavobacteriales bacterium]|jgi:23S rRNA (pseudouridine1915-N3)-methyltransferase